MFWSLTNEPPKGDGAAKSSKGAGAANSSFGPSIVTLAEKLPLESPLF
jgi:hypothetical protein